MAADAAIELLCHRGADKSANVSDTERASNVIEVARRRCRPGHVPGRVGQVKRPCDTCLEVAIRDDERVATQLEFDEDRQVRDSWRAHAARRMRAGGVRITAIMHRLGASYEDVWMWLNVPLHESSSRRVPAVVFEGAA